ncbi:MAG TPA: 16S rRNA processing protein RimM [Clostridiales bacterium]|nr:16S rRNA processing protein RimM [Clostridiales bacterium]
MDNYLRVGVISSTHGIKGEVKVFPTTDDVNRFKELKTVFLDTGKNLHPQGKRPVSQENGLLKENGPIPKGDELIPKGNEFLSLEIEGVKFFKQMVILKFKGIDDINDAEKYRGRDLLVDRENAVKLEEGEYFIYDLIGSEVITDEGETLGSLAEILATGANDVYVVKTGEGKELLIPSIKECILDVDAEHKKITVHLLNGLR